MWTFATCLVAGSNSQLRAFVQTKLCKERKVRLELTEAAKARHSKIKLIYHKRYIYTGK